MLHFLFKVTTLFVLLSRYSSASVPSKDLIEGDSLYAERENIQKAYQALSLYEKHLDQIPNDANALWRASMANYYIGHVIKNSDKRLQYFKTGIKQGEKCNNVTQYKMVECYFWLATNTALLKKEKGIFSLAFGISSIINLYEKALKIDSLYANSGPYRMLALLYYKAPSFLGGDTKKAYEYINSSIKQSPEEPLNTYFLIKFLNDDGKKEQALSVTKDFISSHQSTQFDYFESKTAYKNIIHYGSHQSFMAKE